MDVRTGIGYDVHRLAEDEVLWLGGIRLESKLGTVGHSDADVLIHAICDALLGAANLGDIGEHFPDSDSDLKGVDSKKLLRAVNVMIKEAGYAIGNIDSTVCVERPKLSPHIKAMKECLAGVLGLESSKISIKATTSERMGFVGRQEGIAAYATVLIIR